MRSKTPLALMEQLAMALVFALAAALCLQAFMLADRISRQSEDVDRAMLEMQSAAETLKSCRGDYSALAAQRGGEWNGVLWGMSYDEHWQQALPEDQAAYHLLAMPADSGEALLGAAEVTAYTADGQVLCTLPVTWQLPAAAGGSGDGEVTDRG